MNIRAIAARRASNKLHTLYNGGFSDRLYVPNDQTIMLNPIIKADGLNGHYHLFMSFGAEEIEALFERITRP